MTNTYIIKTKKGVTLRLRGKDWTDYRARWRRNTLRKGYEPVNGEVTIKYHRKKPKVRGK